MHRIQAKGILSPQNGMNIYRGCTHGCIYCDSRSRCYGFTHPFTDVEVKENALSLLEEALRAKRKRCMIGTGAMSDPYMPLERELGLTRGAEELIARYGFGFAVQTKSPDILRDIELLDLINRQTKCVVQMTLTTFDPALCAVVEPHVADTQRRIQALSALHERGIPTVVWLSPLLPFLNDTEKNLGQILLACRDAGVLGVIWFGAGLTLREGNREYYYACLDRHFPGLSDRYRRRYGFAYEIASPQSDALAALFYRRCEDYGLMTGNDALFSYLHAFPAPSERLQGRLF